MTINAQQRGPGGGQGGGQGGAHLLFHIWPGGKGALGQRVRALVDLVIKDRQPKVRHPEVIDIREDQCQACLDRVPVFHNLVELAAGITTGFLHAW